MNQKYFTIDEAWIFKNIIVVRNELNKWLSIAVHPARLTILDKPTLSGKKFCYKLLCAMYSFWKMCLKRINKQINQ